MDPNAMHPLRQVMGVGAAILPMTLLGVVLAVASRRRRAVELAELAERPAPPAAET